MKRVAVLPSARRAICPVGACVMVALCLAGSASASALRIAGTVTATGGAAIEGATIEVFAETAGEQDEPLAAARSDRRGRFAVVGLAEGKHRVAIAARGYLPWQTTISDARGGAEPLRIELAKAAFLAGVVADAERAPVRDAEVRTERPGGAVLNTRTDAKGRFRVGPVADGEKVRIDVLAPGVGAVSGWEAVAPRDDLRIAIRGAGALRGRVFDSASGLPVERFRIEVAGPGGSGQVRAKRFESVEGGFEWHLPQRGAFAATVSAPGYELHLTPRLELPADGSDVDLTVALNPQAVVRGRVTDAASGQPIADALITARAGVWTSYPDAPAAAPRDAERPFGVASARTDADGAFTLRQLPDATVTVRVSAEGYLPHAAALPAGEGYLDVELATGSAIRGWLVGADGERVDGVVALWHPLSMARRAAAATAAGGFQFRQVAAGRYRVWGHASAAERRLPFREDRAGTLLVAMAGQDVDDLEIAVEAGGGCDVAGVVRGLFPEETARVELTHFNGKATRAQGVRVAKTGRFRLRVSAGAVRLRARTNAGRALSRGLAAPCDGAALGNGGTVDFAFTGRSKLFGTVTRQGEPVRGEVRVTGADSSARSSAGVPRLRASVATSASGQYAIRGLTDGAYMLEVVGTAYRQRVAVAGDTRIDVQLGDDERPVDYTGTITAQGSGAPLPGVYVSLKRDTGTAPPSLATARYTDARGAFRAPLAPGRYLLFAHKTGFVPVWRHQEISRTNANVAIELATAPGPLVRLTDAQTGQPLPVVALGIHGAPGGVPLRLSQAGTAPLWPGLVGRDLLFRYDNYQEVRVPAWNGDALDLKMVAAAPTEGDDAP